MKKPFEIVFEDDYLIVVNKTAKILVQPSPKKEKYTLTSLLKTTLKKNVYPCHRLDRETSGLIIYAKTPEVQRIIMEEFRAGEVRKKYAAFVKGRLQKREGMLEDYIVDKEGRYFGEKPKKAKTIYCVLREFKDFSIVELKPLTGRTNQLRIQMAKLGNPILGERKYAFGRDFRVNFKRLGLHAYFLDFIHPISKERVDFSIGLAHDMKSFLADWGVFELKAVSK